MKSTATIRNSPTTSHIPGARRPRSQAALSTEALAQYDLVITTYAMVQRYDVLQTFTGTT